MTKTLFVAGFLVISCFFSFAQDCKFYYPKTEGAKLEYTSYDAKDKITGSSIQTVKQIEENNNVISAMIEVQMFDKKAKSWEQKNME